MLGRSGDILNILPAIGYESKTNGYKPTLIVAKDFSGLVEGCSYITPDIWEDDFRECRRALNFALRKYRDCEVLDCSVYGNHLQRDNKCTSFLRESWRLSKCPVPWGKLPLTFDQRSKEREAKLLKLCSDKPIILTAIQGYSSPFIHGKDLLLKCLNEKLKDDYQIINLSEFKAFRLYDLLALYERAHCLISIDSAPLHLAHAAPDLPVISLITNNSNTWCRSSWLPNHILRLLYSEVANNLDEIVKAAKAGFDYKRQKVHVVTSYSTKNNPDTQRRIDFARQTWEEESKHTGLWEIHAYNRYKRKSAMSLPYITDMINSISKKAGSDDILMIINSDVSVVPGITGWILEQVNRNGAVYMHRHDFQRYDSPCISEAEAGAGKWYPGSDAFAFKKSWREKNKNLFPDLIFGREAWDMIMRNLIKRAKGSEIHNAIYHEKHNSAWERPENRNDADNTYNRKLADEWLKEYGGLWDDWKLPSEKLKYK